MKSLTFCLQFIVATVVGLIASTFVVCLMALVLMIGFVVVCFGAPIIMIQITLHYLRTGDSYKDSIQIVCSAWDKNTENTEAE